MNFPLTNRLTLRYISQLWLTKILADLSNLANRLFRKSMLDACFSNTKITWQAMQATHLTAANTLLNQTQL